jgi:hypothetical protein
MGPAVLGSALPGAYHALFSVDVDVEALRQQHDAQTQQRMESLQLTDATDPAMSELLRQRQSQWNTQLAAIESLRDQRATGILWAVLGAIVVVMLLEALLSPQPDDRGRSEVRPAYRQLICVRYALLAMGIAIMLARPSLLAQVPAITTALMIVAALVVGLIPLSRVRASQA